MPETGTLWVLADNNTLIDRYFLGEPAASYYLELDGLRILLDTGYSDVFLRNAEKLGIDLNDEDTRRSLLMSFYMMDIAARASQNA